MSQYFGYCVRLPFKENVTMRFCMAIADLTNINNPSNDNFMYNTLKEFSLLFGLSLDETEVKLSNFASYVNTDSAYFYWDTKSFVSHKAKHVLYSKSSSWIYDMDKLIGFINLIKSKLELQENLILVRQIWSDGNQETVVYVKDGELVVSDQGYKYKTDSYGELDDKNHPSSKNVSKTWNPPFDMEELTKLNLANNY